MSVGKRNTSLVLAFCFILSLISTVFPVNVSANNEVYENAFNIQAALDYAKMWAINPKTLDPYDDYHNPQYRRHDKDCTNFVSQCLVAAGLPEDKNWNRGPKVDDRYHPPETSAYNTFTGVEKLQKYLKNNGYEVYVDWSFVYPSAGDVVQFDWTGDGKFDHSVLCIGEDSDGILKYAAHSTNRFNYPFDKAKDDACRFAVIYMTDTRGMEEVTSEFAGKFVAIKSNEVNQYVYADDNGAFANRSNPILYEVVRGNYGAVGFRAPNGKFLCTDLNAGDSRYAPLAAKYQDRDVLTWESFRIFRKGSDYYIQSQATGKWVQAVASGDTNHTVKAAARAASTWERFDISASTIINGEFFIRSTLTKKANKVLDVYYGKDSTKYAKNVQIHEANEGNNQKFRISHIGNGWHRIQSVASGKSLDVEGGYSRSGTNVIVWDSHNGDNQCWRLIPDGSCFRIQSKLGGFLDVSGGNTSNETNVLLWEGHGGSNQRWALYKTSNHKLYSA